MRQRTLHFWSDGGRYLFFSSTQSFMVKHAETSAHTLELFSVQNSCAPAGAVSWPSSCETGTAGRGRWRCFVPGLWVSSCCGWWKCHRKALCTDDQRSRSKLGVTRPCVKNISKEQRLLWTTAEVIVSICLDFFFLHFGSIFSLILKPGKLHASTQMQIANSWQIEIQNTVFNKINIVKYYYNLKCVCKKSC